jgi:hypothetical protein
MGCLLTFTVCTVPVRSEFKSRQTVLRCGNKLDILISESSLHEGKEMQFGYMDFLYFSIKCKLL